MRFSLLGKLAVLAAPLALLAQSPDEIKDWAHPPYVILRHFNGPDIGGYTPGQMRTAYGFSKLTNQGAGQIIGIIDAFDNPDAESDLATFTAKYGLPSCTTANGCFKKIYAAGTPPLPNAGWEGEISLDIEWSHAIAPQAKIYLVEGASNSNKDLDHAVDVAVQNGATVVSMSYGGVEYSGETREDTHFNVSGVTFVTSSGDGGHAPQYPAASPYVVAVGGTTLTLSGGGVWMQEKTWSGSGGGASKYETEPGYQMGYQTTGMRGIPDVAYDANPATGVAVYSKDGFGGWAEIGGTSIGAPQWAGLFAIANSGRVIKGKKTLTQPQVYLYPNSETDYHDIVDGKTNGNCGAQCTPGVGYDFITGVGSPQADLLAKALVNAP